MTDANGAPNIHTVTAADPPFLFHRGEGYERHRLPVGTTVIYANPPSAPLPDRRAAIETAIDHPLDADPLDALLRPGMKVTIAFDDVSLPLPRMARPDVRQSVIEVVLERLDRAGVADIELICAICLHRRVTPAELKHMLGPAIFKRFWPKRLYNHDAEDPDGNVELGATAQGECVEINRRAAESDLIIYVNINLVTMDGGHKSVPVGLATYKSVRHHHNAATMLHDSSYMDPPNSAFHRSCERMGDVVARHVTIFTIETTLNGDLFSSLLGFLQKREHAWNIRDRLTYHGTRVGLAMLPAALRRKAYNALPAPYGLTGVHAGDTTRVHEKTLANIDREQAVHVAEQADILLVGLPSIGPYNVDSILNPILVQCLATGYFFNFYRNRPLVRNGGFYGYELDE
ncbi:MAG: lactate racemase domain-containing protein [Phycisphaerae bacterium]